MDDRSGSISQDAIVDAARGISPYSVQCDTHTHPGEDSAPFSVKDVETFVASARESKKKNVRETSAVVDRYGVWFMRMIESDDKKSYYCSIFLQ
jgi:hypothetical protein